MSDAPASFEVVDVLGGLVSLERRSSTLDGSVRLRAAQACTPLLEGNALGFQLVLRDPVRVRRRALGGLDARVSGTDDVAARLRAALPMLVARGLVAKGGAWAERLAAGVVVASRRRVSLFTGLFVRPNPGVRLRASTTRNRRSLAYDVREAILDDASALVPLVLEIDPAWDDVTLAGEIASLVPLPAATTLRALSLADAPEVVRAHVDFYDRAYFEAKRGGSSPRKYRSALARQEEPPPAPWGEAALESISAGDAGVAPSRPTTFHRASGPVEDAAAPLDRLVVRSPIPLAVTWDGLRVVVEPEPRALAAFAAATRAAWKGALEAHAAEPHEGALLYFTKYVTPHPPGEPHFFVKPACLFRTPPGVSTWVEGRGGPGYEILRGVVETDGFHAVPAVFELVQPGARVEIAAGAALAELFAIPRSLAASGFSQRELAPFAERAPEVAS